MVAAGTLVWEREVELQVGLTQLDHVKWTVVVIALKPLESASQVKRGLSGSGAVCSGCVVGNAMQRLWYPLSAQPRATMSA